MVKARAFDAAKYRNNPKMIAKYLNHALAKGDGILITQAIGDMIRAHPLEGTQDPASRRL
jgi:DNA-binding phage protein